MRGLLGWLALAVVLAGGSAAAAEAPVVVTIKPVHALVAAIMRGAGEPVLLVDGFSSPHTFALRPSGARAVQKADIFIRVAGEVEPFTLRLIETLPSQVQVLTLIDAPACTRSTAGLGARSTRTSMAVTTGHHRRS